MVETGHKTFQLFNVADLTFPESSSVDPPIVADPPASEPDPIEPEPVQAPSGFPEPGLMVEGVEILSRTDDRCLSLGRPPELGSTLLE